MEKQDDKIQAEKILVFLRENPGQKAKIISRKLNIETRIVNQILYGFLRNQCAQDKDYRWYFKDDIPKEFHKNKNEVDTPLSRLCHYYAACIAEDKGLDISVFAKGKYGLDYKELDKLPMFLEDESDLFSSLEVQGFIHDVMRDKSKGLYFGYPTVSIHVHSAKWDGFILCPIFLFSIKIPEEVGCSAEIDYNFPTINKRVLEKFTGARGEELIKEMVQLEEELGLSGEGEQPELDDLVQRLKRIRPEWQWTEEVDPYNISSENCLADYHNEGILNRGIVLRVKERVNNYTKGLEYELSKLAKLSEGEYRDTALGQWINRSIDKNNEKISNSLLEVLPMNLEQRAAVEKSLKNKLTIITGPPGTGKSQVVTNLLINAAWQNKRVLFASKNNKAVDVVDVRINNIGDKPILLRMGSGNEYQRQLIRYISNLLAESVDENDKAVYEEKKKEYENMQNDLLALDSKMQELISLRNVVDKLDREVNVYRKEFSTELFEYVKRGQIDTSIEALLGFLSNLERIVNTKSSFVSRVIRLVFKNLKYKKITQKVTLLEKEFMLIDVECPDELIGDTSTEKWNSFYKELKGKVSRIASIQKYFEALENLQKAQSFEDLAKNKDNLLRRMALKAEDVWRLWLKVRTGDLSQADRSLLSQYKTTLQMVSQETPSKGAWRNYFEQSQRISHILPCWAVTSLSAKGRIPMREGLFDLVVFDESSQCDIASALPLLYRAKQAVIIGDPKQLSHISAISKRQDERLLENYGLIGGYSDWAYSYNSLYDLASGLTGGGDLIDLRDHYRSHADIINFSNDVFYGKHLRVATKYDSLQKLKGEDTGIRWVNVVGVAEKPNGGSGSRNNKEAKAVVDELRRLVEQGYEGTIGVVSPFRAQANLIKRMVESDEILAVKLSECNFLCETVHKFQGDERDVMIFSPVISKNMPNGSIIFLKNTGNLFNVAITRARAVLIVVGDSSAVASCGIPYMEKFSNYVRLLHSEKQKTNIVNKKLGRAYPVVSNPERVSEWEHIFYEKLYDADIKTIPQYQEEKYTLDFALLIGDKKLNIEVDGEHYHKDLNGELCYRDQIRNQRMFELGWDVKRFWVYEIRDDVDGCIEKIKSWIETSKK